MAYRIGGLWMIRDHPWQGVGIGNYGPEYDAKYYTSPFMVAQVHAHNYYIHIAAETGVIGLAAYLLLIGGVLTTGISAARRARHDPFARALAIGGVGVVVAVAAHNLFEDLHVLSMDVHLSAIWALLAVINSAESSVVGQES
jgi:O-antigen ligase